MNIKQLRAQIAALQALTIDENKNFRSANYDKGKFDALSAVDALLDSLQEEPVSEELEYASEKYACRFSSSKYGHDKVKDAFIAGADWQKDQMIKYSMECRVQVNGMNERYLPLHDIILDDNTLNEGDKVKLVIIKED